VGQRAPPLVEVNQAILAWSLPTFEKLMPLNINDLHSPTIRCPLNVIDNSRSKALKH
jgi:hypothetical protein